MCSLRNRLAFLGGVLGVWMWAAAVRADEPRTIRVTGEGKATAPPDVAAIFTGVVTKAPTALEALEENSKAMQKVLDVVKTFDIAPRDVQTTSFSVQPVYDRDAHGRPLPAIVAYSVTNQVRLRVRRLPDLGKVLDALVKAGSNQVSGIHFDVDDPAEMLKLARERAMADARSRAETYARGAGVQVGAVQVISEQPFSLPPPRYFEAALDRGSAVPIATGEQEIRVSVQVIFAIASASPTAK
jgi:uncharacterized protein YggE